MQYLAIPGNIWQYLATSGMLIQYRFLNEFFKKYIKKSIEMCFEEIFTVIDQFKANVLFMNS